MPDRPFNVSTLFADLGWDIQGSDLDEAVRWALVELYLQRKLTQQLMATLENRCDCLCTGKCPTEHQLEKLRG